MRISRLLTVFLGSVLLLGGLILSNSRAPVAEAADDDAKPAPTLPKDPKAIVLSYDPGANGFIRKGPPPYLQIQADGQVTVTNVFDGSKKESKLTTRQLEELLRFVIQDSDFFDVTEAKIAEGIKAESEKGTAIALGGVGTSVIKVQADDKRHEVTCRGAREYARAYPKIKALAKFVAVEKRLADFAQALEKGKGS